MKIQKGDILQCCPDSGCGLKVVVIGACEEADCDLKCCGKDMAVAKGAAGGKSCAKETDPELWKKCAEGEKE